MYPERELAALATAKARLRQRIAGRRQEIAETLERVTGPLRWVDAGVALWRQFTPFVKIALVPLGLLLGRKVARRAGTLSALFRWAPVIVQAVRGFRPAGR